MVVVLQMLTLCVGAQDRKREIADTPNFRQLAPVFIKSSIPLAVRKGDTVMFDAGRYRTAATFRLSDLLNQLPGFRVDERGRIYYNGKEVNRLLIDGDDLTGEHYGLISSRLRAGLISKVQLMEKYQSVKLLRGIQKGNETAVNLVFHQNNKQQPSGSLQTAAGSKIYSLQADLIMFNKLKSLLFADKGNFNNRSGQLPEILQENFSLWKDYFSFQLPGAMVQELSFLPAAYHQVKSIQTATWVMTAKPDSFSQIKLLFNASLFQFNLNEREEQLYFPQKDLHFIRETERKDLIQSYKGKLELERNKKNNRSSNFQVLWKYQANGWSWQQRRTGFLPYQEQIQNQVQQQLLQVRQEELLKFSNGMIKVESGFGIDNLREDKLILGTPIYQVFRYYRKTGRLHLSWIQKPGRIQFTKGFVMLIENNYSSINFSNQHSGFLKIYPYATVNYAASKKWRQTVQLAGGALSAVMNRNSIWYSIYHAELRTEWQRKPTTNYFISFQATQKMQEGFALYAGPFYLNSRTSWYSAEVYAVPRNIQLQTGMVKMNLYSGLILNAYLQTIITTHEQGIQFSFADQQEKLLPFLISRRLGNSGQLNIEKFIHSANIRITTTVRYNRSFEPRRFNGKEFETIMRNITIENKMNSHWKKPFNLSAYCIYNAGTFRVEKDMNQQTLIRSYRAGSSMYYRLNKKGIVQVHGMYVKTGKLKGFTAIDLEMTYNLKARCKLNLMAYNLLNHRFYRAYELTTVGTSDYRRYLNGRNIMLGLAFDF
jgi:hypothetical protein